MAKWHLYTGSGKPQSGPVTIPDPPPWRKFNGETWTRELKANARDLERGKTFKAEPSVVDMVNAALYLRRPLLVTGDPGSGKSSLAYAVAYELNLGPVLRWNITSRVTLKEGLYTYDVLGRLQDANLPKEAEGEGKTASKEPPDIGQYIRLGPLGTALLPVEQPRVLLIDEIDKSDMDLPNDLLNIFEEGEYEIPELFRLRKRQREVQVRPSDGEDEVPIKEGRVQCCAFPFVVLTSNGEREFSPALLRRCLHLEMPPPNADRLKEIVKAHLADAPHLTAEEREQLIDQFLEKRHAGVLATDQLLNALFLVAGYLKAEPRGDRKQDLVEKLLQPLGLGSMSD